MLLPYEKKRPRSGAYFEFQYCKKKGSIASLVRRDFDFWQKDSLFVDLDDDTVFFEAYLTYLVPTHAPNGTDEFSPYGVNYYTKAQTADILERIRKDQPKDSEILIPWLAKAAEEYNGFYFLGV